MVWIEVFANGPTVFRRHISLYMARECFRQTGIIDQYAHFGIQLGRPWIKIKTTNEQTRVINHHAFGVQRNASIGIGSRLRDNRVTDGGIMTKFVQFDTRSND